MKFRFLFVLLILAMLTSCQTQAPNTQAIVETSVAATVAAGERAAAEVGVKRTMEAIKASGGFVESRVADAQAEYGMNTGLTVSKGDVITFSASGEWCWGGTTDCSSPDGTVGRPSAEENSAFYNGYYFGTLLGRVGESPVSVSMKNL